MGALESQFAIRPATAADSAAIIAVIRNVYHEYRFIFEATEETPDVLAFEKHYDGQRGAFFVGTLARRVVGTAGIRLHAAGTAEIVRLYLGAGLRGQGYGYRLLQHGVDWATAQGARRIMLWSDTRFAEAHRLYSRFGFVPATERQLQDVNQSREYQFIFDLGS